MKRKHITSVIATCAVLFLLSVASAWARAYRVAIVPFQINSERDLTFLKNGITDMLTSRLSWEGRVTVLNKEETARAAREATGAFNDIQAQILGAKMGADYVLYGSLTIFGDSVSMDAKMIDVAGGREPVAFYNVTQGMGQVIPKINGFASEINQKVFGRAMPAAPAPLPAPAAAPAYGAQAAAPGQPGASPAPLDSRANPERIFEADFGKDVKETSRISSLNPAFVVTSGREPGGRAFWKSRSFDILINGIAAGDVDGDGKIETVVATSEKLLVYRRINSVFAKVYETELSGDTNVIGVDVGDINGNGSAEIFVTGLNRLRNRPRSTVYEYNGRQIVPIVEASARYYRVVDSPLKGKILLAQYPEPDSPLEGPLVELIWNNGQYIDGSPIVRLKRSNLMGLAYGDVMNDGSEVVVAYNWADYLEILGAGGKKIWEGSQPYGGSTHYYLKSRENKGDIENRQYLPMRLLIADLNNDGKNEVIAVKNIELTGRRLAGYRKFTNAEFVSFSWDGLGLVEDWKTREISGFIRDFAIADFDNDGKKEIVAAVIQKDGAIIGMTPESTIISYDLKQ